MGAVHHHTFEMVRKGYAPDAVDDVILQLTIAKNDAEALATKLQRQLEQQVARGNDSEASDRVLLEARDEAQRLIDEARHQAETTIARSRTEADKILSSARTRALDLAGTGASASHDVTALLQIAERFETELTKIAKGALGDVGAIAGRLRQHTDSPPSAPSPARPAEPAARPRRAAPAESSGSSTLDMLRRQSAVQRDEPAGGAKTSPLAAELDDESLEEAKALAARLVAQRTGTSTTDPGTVETRRAGTTKPRSPAEPRRPIEPEESTSLASRIARERGTTPVANGDGERGSFYSRRSARLPRIGEDAAAGALASVRSVRRAGEGDDSDDEEDAARTA